MAVSDDAKKRKLGTHDHLISAAVYFTELTEPNRDRLLLLNCIDLSTVNCGVFAHMSGLLDDAEKLKDVEEDGEKKKEGDDGTQKVVQMEACLTVMMKSMWMDDKFYISKSRQSNSLFPGDCSERWRWVDSRLWAVQVDDAPVGDEKQRRDRRGLE